ncbi:LacI family DNA-binding transcriptional regulator [Paenibacillus sp. GD4]|uniref:LacI family DNA-binding transcriptional regulator n=1 Tax=Paenibacillus sp. GD4 TaxID=3068890 RepID=UPI00279666B8|nr:LacI family DNA-binding transcriptional regulator [Paenibacillus sp. GD4]MDQ1909666.1 LacI family DNA-binding transcriptional regulator [Paenibacillus sp. GD4]
MATINDVAKKAGVSKGTVSSVFSKKRPISHEVAQRVLSVAKELGYYPNHVARSLANKKTMIAGLKMPLSRDGAMSAFESQMINGVIKECSKQGYRVLLDTLPEHDDPTQFSLDPVDGVIMLNPRKDDPRVERYGQMGIPLVLVGRPDPIDDSISYVDNNNTEAAYQVGDYLLGNGHKSILFLNAFADMTAAYDRKHGLEQAFAKYGVPFREEYVLNYSRRIYSSAPDYGYNAIMTTYRSLSYSAVITDTDRVALGVLRAARELGLDVPEDLSVVALSNDATLAQEMTPKLTSVELSAHLLGTEAAKLLIEKMNDMSVNRQLIIDTKLVIRESCCVRGT